MSIYQPTAHSEVPLDDKVKALRDSWITMAVQYIRTRKDRKVARAPTFITEDLAIEMQVIKLPAPPDNRLWGIATQRAEREGLIRKTGGRRLTRAGHRTPIWEQC